MLESYLIMDTFIKELADSGLESVIKKRGLYSCYNEEGTLCILCYKHKIRKNKFVRGLVVETAHPHKTVSKGFDTFNTRDLHKKDNIAEVTVKEDGTLMFMFKYHDTWHLTTIHNFANDTVYDGDMTYYELFLEIIDCDLSTFGDYLESVFPDDTRTYCFEMCSLYNRIVGKYPTPTLYLLSAFSEIREYSPTRYVIMTKISEEYGNVKLLTHVSITNFMQVKEYIEAETKENDTFEGVVVMLSDGSRVKLKNPRFRTYQKVKYRGWVSVERGSLDSVMLENLKYLVISPEDYEKIMEKNTTGDSKLSEEHGNPLHWKFLPEYELDHKEVNDGMSTSHTHCYCGEPMVTKRLKIDLIKFKYCHCGQPYDYLTYPAGNLLGICSSSSDSGCECTHEVNKLTDKFLGTPASNYCKTLRLIIHSMMSYIIDPKNIDKDSDSDIYMHTYTKNDLYKLIGEIIGESDPHMASMGISQCVQVIKEFQHRFS